MYFIKTYDNIKKSAENRYYLDNNYIHMHKVQKSIIKKITPIKFGWKKSQYCEGSSAIRQKNPI